MGVTLNKRRFRANLYANLLSTSGFAEDEFAGRKLQVGSKVVVVVLERGIRCRMIGFDTLEMNSGILQYVARDHEGKAGVYAAVLIEGAVRAGDEILLVE